MKGSSRGTICACNGTSRSVCGRTGLRVIRHKECWRTFPDRVIGTREAGTLEASGVTEMDSRLANDEWQRRIWKALKHPAVEVTLLVLVIVASAWVIFESDAFGRQAGMPLFKR